ncbi:MAG TPA: M23 family metallopeptidase [Myxococcota bacterium]|nr:M23 family metallopeptidase [Myxococcota bacterium]
MMRSILGVLGLLLAVGAAGVATLRCEGTPPSVKAPERLAIGHAPRSVAIEVDDAGSGVNEVAVALVHPGGEATLLTESFPARWIPFGAPAPPQHLEVPIDPTALGLKEGTATLRITATDHAWRHGLSGNQTQVEVPVALDFHPPRITLQPANSYERRGGAGAVVYEVSEATARDGVQVGERFFPSVRPGGGDAHAAGPRFALFPLPIDAPPDAKPIVVAVDAAGNEGRAVPQIHVTERTFPEVLLPLSPKFIDEKIPELAGIVGVDASDHVKAFQEINTRIRGENEARIREVVKDSAPEPLFSGAFEQLANSKVTSTFAESRSYLVDGKKVSESRHYGYDLAALASTPVTASNAGRVLFAGENGVYGNCVILDHGLGVSSLYGHLSAIHVQPGDKIEKGQVLGLSGQTGLAGGDHLHFAILLDGVYVDPVEWWDPKWVREHVEEPLASAKR